MRPVSNFLWLVLAWLQEGWLCCRTQKAIDLGVKEGVYWNAIWSFKTCASYWKIVVEPGLVWST